jgi:hypothetical protein
MSQMDGRWEIFVSADGALAMREVDDGATYVPVPVVPCDDAAIRRVVAEMKTIPLMDVAEEPYATAERLLRAAGETP